jgi:radical SAM superfamily enzyme YgiQ (UPF0313 family)
MKQLDLLLIHPNASKEIYQDLSKNYSAIEPPIWVALLANYARLVAGYSVKILDCEAEQLTAAESAKIINDYNPRLATVVVYGQQPSASTQNMSGVHALCDILHDSYGNIKTLLIGLHPSAISRQTLNDEKVDFVCQGEGLYTLSGLLEIDNMNDTSQLQKIPGLWYRENGETRFTSPAPIVPQELLATEMPGMAWDLLPMDKYRTSNWHAMSNNNLRQPFASLYTSLGCPFRCSFCCINAPFGNNNVENWDSTRNKFRFWDPDFMITEFAKIQEMGIRNVKIADEMFVLNKSHFLEICNKIVERQYDFNIWAYARIDTVKPEFLEPLKNAGINWLALGIESGNTVVRKDVVKGKFTEVNIRDLVKQVQDAGINVIGNYIFGLPEDNLDTMQDTLDLATDLNCEFANFYSAMAYPGSKLYLDAIRENWELPDSYVGYSQHAYETKPLPTKYISAAAVLEFRDAAFDAYYTNDRYLNFIIEKFGQETYDDIIRMTQYKLKRKLLEV